MHRHTSLSACCSTPGFSRAHHGTPHHRRLGLLLRYRKQAGSGIVVPSPWAVLSRHSISIASGCQVQ